MYVDVHTHLTHKDFDHDRHDIIKRAINAGLGAIVCNGLEPESNRQILQLAQTYPQVIAALGIYPINAINHLAQNLSFEVKAFDVDSEIQFIEEAASRGYCTAIGECGLDGYWVGEETFQEQERVFLKLMEIAERYRLPLIIHTRKLEKRAMEILKHHGIKKVNFHCYGGRVSWAISGAEEHGWYFSIPANARKNEAFTKMLRELPEDRILTETDAPYLSPNRGVRNEPENVVQTVEYLAEIRGWSQDETKNRIWQNYQTLFA